MEEKQSRGSLGGQNGDRRIIRARSSRALSAIFKILRKLDADISAIDKKIKYSSYVEYFVYDGYAGLIKMKEERASLDKKRKAVRLQRKGYK